MSTGAAEHGGGLRGRFGTALIWALVVLGLWLWGRLATDGSAFGDGAGGARAANALPPAQEPLDGVSRPVRLDIDKLDVHARVLGTGLDGDGGVAAPPYSKPGAVGWYRAGASPGERGAALVVGHVDTDERRAVFYPLSTAERGTRLEITTADGTVEEFTVEDVEVVERGRFDPARTYGPRKDGRAELRLLTCGGTFDRAARTYSSNVVVSAYLTGVRTSQDV